MGMSTWVCLTVVVLWSVYPDICKGSGYMDGVSCARKTVGA